MPEGGFYEQKRISPTSLAVVILLHGAAITALALSKMEVPQLKVFKPLPIQDYKNPPEPEPIPEPQKQPQSQPKSQIDYVPPRLPDLPRSSIEVDRQPVKDLPVFDPGPIGRDVTPPADPKPLPIPDPVRVEAQMLRSSELQPPYPAAEERGEIEGSVSIRVTIGANGRVLRAEKVSATNDNFYRATERHALRAWRFKPATLDGRPVESTKVITVRFRLEG